MCPFARGHVPLVNISLNIQRTKTRPICLLLYLFLKQTSWLKVQADLNIFLLLLFLCHRLTKNQFCYMNLRPYFSEVGCNERNKQSLHSSVDISMWNEI